MVVKVHDGISAAKLVSNETPLPRFHPHRFPHINVMQCAQLATLASENVTGTRQLEIRTPFRLHNT